MLKENSEPSRGILHPQVGLKKFRITRYPPAPELAFFVERYWIVSWELCKQESYIQETLPYPCVNLVFERNNSRIFGVSTRKFARLLEGKGHVFSVKFKPGAFYPFWQAPISQLTDTSVSFEQIFGNKHHTLETTIFDQKDEAGMLAIIEDFLRQSLPAEDEQIRLANCIIDYIDSQDELLTVEKLAGYFNLTMRTLQRLFNQYVGVSPRWVIKRYRLQKIAERLINDQPIDGTQLALELGYFDQAHFIKDFKAAIGKTPAEYARQNTYQDAMI